MPNTANPKIEEWVDYLNSKVDLLNEETYFIGHSIGCQICCMAQVLLAHLLIYQKFP